MDDAPNLAATVANLRSAAMAAKGFSGHLGTADVDSGSGGGKSIDGEKGARHPRDGTPEPLPDGGGADPQTISRLVDNLDALWNEV